MECFVGTSGWMYPWNREGTLEWYMKNTGLNAIELNASFYRFPFPNQVKGWSAKGANLAWVVKVNRRITHIHMLNYKAVELFSGFVELFKPLDMHIAFYLLQMPPRFTTNMEQRFVEFAKGFNEKKLAVEFRHESWYGFDFSKLDFGGAVVSPDSPEINGTVWSKNKVVYLRFHGRRSWYSYKYSTKELKGMADRAKELSPKRMFAFFNNNHNMQANAVMFKKLLM